MLGQRVASAKTSLTDLSLEELMDIPVNIVSKHSEKLANAPAAVFALTADDIERSGSDTIPDALRLVPGLQVGQADSHSWAIGSRGFPDVFANKLLVLQDGRSVYTPLFSGVFWNAQDVVLDDIERIEVVRGPGATLWGANAVNGVINILTKSSAETQGGLADVTVGTETKFAATARYGGEIDKDTHFRVYAKYSDYGNFPTANGPDNNDAWNHGQAGFRMDRQDSAGNLLTVQGDASQGRDHETFLVPISTYPFVAGIGNNDTYTGANVLARWTHTASTGDELRVQSYFDYTNEDTMIFGEVRRTFDIEAQQRVALGDHEITIGGGYRTSSDNERNTRFVSLTPPRLTTDLWNGFIQDDITLVPKTLHLILGSKFEHNDFTGWETQPGIRLLWTPNTQNTFWASAARAVRTPSIAEEDVRLSSITSTPGVAAQSVGNANFHSEVLGAFEAGYRWHARDKFTLDVSGFVNRYRGLRTSELPPASLAVLYQLLSPFPPLPPVTLTAIPSNELRGETYGGEIAVATQLAPDWRVRASFSHLDVMLHRTATSTDMFSELDEGRTPKSQGYLWSQHDISKNLQFDWVVRVVGPVTSDQIPGYTTLDVRLAWSPIEHWQLSLVGRNLLDKQHPEFNSATIATPAAETPRSGYVEVKHEF